MTEILLACASAIWLGILTTISPCPLATNITAMSFLARRVESPRKVFLAGVLYAMGRMAAYIALGTLLAASLMSASEASQAFQKYMNLLLGPILIIVGMVLLELLTFKLPGLNANEAFQNRIDKLGFFGAFVLGFIFALSFCPVSAALFFGNLLTLMIKVHSPLLLSGLYGLATALPVLGFALLIAFGVQKVGTAFGRLSAFARGARLITGILFIVVGLGYCLTQIFDIQLAFWN